MKGDKEVEKTGKDNVSYDHKASYWSTVAF